VFRGRETKEKRREGGREEEGVYLISRSTPTSALW